jgi:hypothetical protein
MTSQVQVLAGPPLFSQLRGLMPPGRFRSLPAWAAVGPRPPRRRAQGSPRSGRPRVQVHHNEHPSWSLLWSSQGMVGSVGNPARGNLRAAMPQVGERRRVPRSPPDGRSSRSTGLSLVGQAVEPALLHLVEGWHGRSRTQPGSDHQGQLVERDGNAQTCWLLDRELVVSVPQVLHQGVPCHRDPGTAVLLEPAHRP